MTSEGREVPFLFYLLRGIILGSWSELRLACTFYPPPLRVLAVEATQLLSDLCPSDSTRCSTRCGQASKEAPVSWGRVTATGCRELEVASACVLLGSFFVS